MTQTLAILDYGMGNLHSAAKAFAKVAAGTDIVIKITDRPEDVLAADRVVFPGVGAMRDCMAELKKRGLDTALTEVIKQGKPLLGICVGMQALLLRSEENHGVDCLGVFAGKVELFPAGFDDMMRPLKVPHMGWNQVRQTPHPLWEGIPDYTRFYFVHSYRVPQLPEAEVAGYCDYGQSFVAACARDNVFAVQFHPEKSAVHGLALLRNFLHWTPSKE